MEYRIYLFDFDYTLADSEAAIMRCYRAVAKRHGHPDVPDDVIKKGIGHGIAEIFHRMTGIEDEKVLEEYGREYMKECDGYMAENTFLYPETIPVLSELKARGKRLGIISTKARHRIIETVSRYGIENLFDQIIGGGDVSKIKPDPEGVLMALERFGAAKEEVLYTGDSTVDAKTAQNAGIDFAAVTTGATAAEEFYKYPRVMIMTGLDGLL